MPVLVCFLHFVFALVNEGQGCQVPPCSQLYSLKSFNFCNAADMATESVMFHPNKVQIYTVYITVTFRAAGFARVSSSRSSCWCVKLPGDMLGSGREPQGLSLGKPGPAVSLVLLQLSVLAGVSSKSSREKSATWALPQLLLPSQHSS